MLWWNKKVESVIQENYLPFGSIFTIHKTTLFSRPHFHVKPKLETIKIILTE